MTLTKKDCMSWQKTDVYRSIQCRKKPYLSVSEQNHIHMSGRGRILLAKSIFI